MNNFSDNNSFKPKVLHKSSQLINSSKRGDVFADKNAGFESSFSSSTLNPTSFSKMLPHQSTVSSQLFKIPSLDSVPVEKVNIKSIRSPRIRVQSGRVENNLKLNQQSKMNLIPRPSFINSRKSLHGSRCAQLNARKELIKKMVYLAECTLKENKEVKQSTPVKVLAGLTPKKTPRSGGYFILPEFNKKVPKLEDIKSPIEDLIRKEMFSYSNPTPLSDKVNVFTPVKPEEDISDFIIKPKDKIISPNTRFTAVLSQCKKYNAEVHSVHEKLKALDETFEDRLKNLPDYKIYNEFLFYQSKKEDLYKELQALEKDLRNFISSHTNIGCKLKAYVKKKQEIFDSQVSLHKNFEQAVKAALEKCKNDPEETKLEEDKSKPKTPQLRRSLRLSKLKKSKFEERTPVTKRLKKLDSKSKGIQKSGKV